LVRAIAERGVDVAFVAHGHRARIDHARHVSIDDDPRIVGDESLVAARALHDLAPVVVGRSLSTAIAFAGRSAGTLVVDRLLQTRPRALACSVLAVDAEQPWGSGRTFPFGDLLAPREELLAIADFVVPIGEADARHEVAIEHAVDRVGIVTSVARPDRIVRTLLDRGVEPIVHVERSDHAPTSTAEIQRISRLAARHGIDAWLVDEKSSVWLIGDLGAPVRSIAHRLVLAPSIVDRVLASPAR